jgi:hypothetical protein
MDAASNLFLADDFVGDLELHPQGIDNQERPSRSLRAAGCSLDGGRSQCCRHCSPMERLKLSDKRSARILMALLERPDDLLLDSVRNPAIRDCLEVSLVGAVKVRQGGQGRLQPG